MKKLYIFILFFISLYAQNDISQSQKQTVLNIQNLIETEEKIAVNIEKYLLNEFKIPILNELKTDEYLGSNFSFENKYGETIDFKISSELKLKYAILKDEYDYRNLIYKRDIYRNNTNVYEITILDNNKKYIDGKSSYIIVTLKSKEAQNIFNILKNGNTIAKSCTSTLKNVYCSQDEKTIRWYNASSNWIEYSKKDFEDGNVTTNNILLDDVKLQNLKVGAYVVVEDKSKYIKFVDNDFLKVK